MAKITRYNLENYCHFVTSKTYRNSKIFSKDEAAGPFIQTIFEVKEKLNVLLLAFVIMPDHIHLMLVPDKRNTISDVMRHIKGRFSRRYNLLSRGMNSPDYAVQNHRAVNSSSSHEPENHRAGNLSLPKSKVWQESFYDHVIRNKKEFVERLNYIYYNPVKAELVDKPEDYKYSSATGNSETDLLCYVGG
jgi:putative transposase